SGWPPRKVTKSPSPVAMSQSLPAEEYERVIDKLRSSEALCVGHELERFNPLAGGGETGIGRCGRPHCSNRNQSGGDGNQGDLGHLSSPVQLAQDGRLSHSVSATCRTRASGAVIAITKWLISLVRPIAREVQSPHGGLSLHEINCIS